MKNISDKSIRSGLIILILMIAFCPASLMAQRFNHGGFGGGRSFSAPAPRQEMARPAPPRPAPAQAIRPQQAAPGRSEVNRPGPVSRPESINGGSRNFGNHDFNHSSNVTVNVHENSNIHVHENVNVYHTGGYHGFHPYYYHPFRPSYWGPRWHPVGYFLSSLAADALFFTIANQRYYYEDGSYYIPSGAGYSAVPPPIGASVGYLPEGYETTMVGNDTYYYYGGAFYVYNGQTYQVVEPPFGAVVYQLPVGAEEQNINGQTLLVYNNTYYQPISQDGQDAYEVVPMNQ